MLESPYYEMVMIITKDATNYQNYPICIVRAQKEHSLTTQVIHIIFHGEHDKHRVSKYLYIFHIVY